VPGGDTDAMRRLNEAADVLLGHLSTGDAPDAGGAPAPSPSPSWRPAPSEGRRRPTGTGGVDHDVASFVIEALPVEAFEALVLVTSWIGEVVVDEPPYQLDVPLLDPLRCWCRLDLVPDAGASTVGVTIAALQALGHNRTDRKYMIFGESTVYCGIGTFRRDDRPDAGNRNNVGPSYGRSDSGCWTASVAAHELGHNLGAVSNSAPNSSGAGHCVDEFDVMCYRDTPTTVIRTECPARAQNQRLDCNHDDYYSTNPPAGSFLATHWNVAQNQFLIAGAAVGAGAAARHAGAASAPTP